MLALNTTQQQQQQLNHCVTWENELNYVIHNTNNENCGCWNRKISPWEEGEEENDLNSNSKALRCIERHE